MKYLCFFNWKISPAWLSYSIGAGGRLLLIFQQHFTCTFVFSGRKSGVYCQFPWAKGCTNIESLCKYHLRTWRIRLLCVYFFLFSQSLPLSAEEQAAIHQLNLQFGEEMEFPVQEVSRAWNGSIPETFNSCRRGWFCDLILLKWI